MVPLYWSPLSRERAEATRKRRRMNSVTVGQVSEYSTINIGRYKILPLGRDRVVVTNEIAIGDEVLLFKYVSPYRAISCLPEIGDGALRATQPAAMNDPFECAMSRRFVDKDLERGNRELALTLTEIQPSNPIKEEDIAEARVHHGSLYMG